MKANQIKTIFLDGDGVLWRAETAMEGLEHFFKVIDQQSIQWALLTNNNTRTAEYYVQKLQGFGIATEREQVFTSSTVTAAYLRQRFGEGARLHVIGMHGLIETLQEAGFSLTIGDEQPKDERMAVVAGMDRQITHEKIKIAMRLIQGGAAFIATNTDGSFPTPEGLNPGTGMVIGALQATSGVKATVIGKPEAAIFESALKQFNADRATTVMVGDRLETDILGAKKSGLCSIAVLTGVVSREEATTSVIQPDYIFKDITALANALDEGKFSE